MLPKVQVFFHDFGKDKEMTARRMYVASEKLPLMVVTDGACQGMFASVGYSVGMAICCCGFSMCDSIVQAGYDAHVSCREGGRGRR